MSSSPSRAVGRYHGGKFRDRKRIVAHFPAHQTYTEAFGGLASCLLHKPRAVNEIYNDLYGDVVCLFRVLRDPEQAALLREAVALTPYASEEFDAAMEPCEEPVERCRRMLVRSFMGYASNSVFGRVTGFRRNAGNARTAPAREWASYPDCIPQFTERLRGVTIERQDAVKTLTEQDGRTTLHYVDPPYVHRTRNEGNPYCKKHLYAFEMDDDAHRGLAKVQPSLLEEAHV